MKIAWKLTKRLADIIDPDNGFLYFLTSLIIPAVAAVFMIPLMGISNTLGICFLMWLLQIVITSIIYDSSSLSDKQSYFFIWIPFILLAPITIPLDIFTSVSRGIWSWFSERKSKQKIRAAWAHLIEKGLDPKKIDFDKLNTKPDSVLEAAIELFEEVILDQLGRSLITDSEEISIVKCEEHGGKICLIGSFTISENKSRKDGSPNTTVLGRIFAITFSVSKSTGICQVFHHFSQPISEVHEDEHLEDMWFNLTNSSGINSESATDPLKRRRSRHFVDERTGVIIEDQVGGETDHVTELT